MPQQLSDTVKTSPDLSTQRPTEIQNFEGDVIQPKWKVDNLLKGIRRLKFKPTRSQKRTGYITPMASSPPIGVLPAEILAIIFEYCLPEHVHAVRHEAPLSLSHVCSMWRRVALGSPFLWTSIAIYSHTVYPEDLSAFWYHNASGLPMNFRVESYYPISHPLPLLLTAPTHSLNTFLSYSSLFRELDIGTGDVTYIGDFLHLPGGQLPLLEVVSFHCPRGDHILRPVSVFESSPHLREVSIYNRRRDGNWYMRHHSHIHLPWAQLTHLKIEAPLYFADWQDYFRQCVQLQSGKFIVEWGQEMHAFLSQNTPISYAYLKTLTLVCYDRLDFSLLRFAHFPSLTNFTLQRVVDFWVPWNIDRTLLTELSHYPLRHLVLSRVVVTGDMLIASLPQIPSLEKLALDGFIPSYHGNRFDHAILYDLLAPGVTGKGACNPPVLPNLTHLAYTIGKSGDVTSVPSTFLRMVSTRCCQDHPPQCARLRKVTLYMHSTHKEILRSIVGGISKLADPAAGDLEGIFVFWASHQHVIHSDGFDVVLVAVEKDEIDLLASLEVDGGWRD